MKVTHDADVVFETFQDHVAGFGDVPLDLGPAWQEHFGKVRDAPWRTTMWADGEALGNVRESVTWTIKAWIDCVTPDDSPRHYEIEYSVRHKFDGREVKLVRIPKIVSK